MWFRRKVIQVWEGGPRLVPGIRLDMVLWELEDGKVLAKREVLKHEVGDVWVTAKQKRDQVLEYLHVR
jgi:hypothetical protein